MAEDVENKEQVDSTEGTENLKVLENIDVMLTVEVGRTEITIRDLLRLCLLYTSPSPRDVEESRMPSSA